MEFINMDKRFQISKLFMNVIFLLLLLLPDCSANFGYDSANACTPNGKVSRRGRAQMLAAIPCDLTEQAFCHLPGTAYPWHAVRRFVHENQGLMKRMYGDVRHISILRDEIQNNEIDIEDFEMAAERYTKDNPNRRSGKYMLHGREDYLQNHKGNSEVLTEPHFRPMTSTTTAVPTTTTTTTTMTTAAATESTPKPTANTAVVDEDSAMTTTKTATTVDKPASIEATTISAMSSNGKELSNQIPTTAAASINTVDVASSPAGGAVGESTNIESNSVYENVPTSPATSIRLGENIQIIDSPQLGLHNLSNAQQPVIRSTTLKVVTTAKTSPVTRRTQYMTIRRRPVMKPHHQLAKVNATTQKEGGSHADNTTNRADVAVSTSTSTLKLFGAGAAAYTTVKNVLNLTTSSKNMNNNSSPVPNEPAQSVAATSAILPLKAHIDEKISRKPAIASPEATTTTASTNKPVVRDGQLFQDTIKQETPPVLNTRGVNACPVKEEVVAPFWANNTRGEVLALLNLYPFEQYVHWEKCTHEHKQMYCRDGCRCEQQYRLHRLLAYDPHNECRGIFSDWFRFPSSCICKCYDIPLDFRVTSRSPRADTSYTSAAVDELSQPAAAVPTTRQRKHPIELAEEEVKRAIYEHATEQWYRPHDEFDIYEGKTN